MKPLLLSSLIFAGFIITYLAASLPTRTKKTLTDKILMFLVPSAIAGGITWYAARYNSFFENAGVFVCIFLMFFVVDREFVKHDIRVDIEELKKKLETKDQKKQP